MVAALEVAARQHAEVVERRLRVVAVAERRAHLLERPDVELALLALGVGVERRVEAALGAAHLAQRPVERLLADAPEQRLAGHLPAVQVRARQQRVVVEHLLEVGDQPAGVDRVAGEAAADLVVHAAVGHRAQRAPRSGVARSRRAALARGAAGTRSPTRAGTSAPRRSRRCAGRTRARPGLDGARRAARGSSGSSDGSTAGRARQPLGDRSPTRADLVAALAPTPRRPPRAPGASSASRGAPRAGSRCRRRTAPARG